MYITVCKHNDLLSTDPHKINRRKQLYNKNKNMVVH